MPWIRTEDMPGAQVKRNPGYSFDWLAVSVTATFVAGILAMVVTWLLVAYFPFPDDNAIYISLLGFFFVMFFDLLIVSGAAVSKLRQGQRLAPVKESIVWILLGLLAASVVGSLPLLWKWLTIAMPGARDLPWGTLFMLWVAANNLWMRRMTAQDKRRVSQGWLITQGSLFSLAALGGLLLAASTFSNGRIWLGALHLVVALLFGFLAVEDFLEIRKRRRAIVHPEKVDG